MATAIDTAKKALTDRLTQLQTETQKLEAERSQVERALSALAGPASGRTTRQRGRPKGSTTPAKNRAPRGQRRQQVVDHLAAHSPARPTDIAEAINTSANQVHGLLSKLRKDKLVKKTAKGYSLTAAASAGGSAATE